MKLSYKQTFWVGLAFFGISAFWSVYDGVVPLLLKGAFDLRETLIGAIMAADNVLALFLLPLLGALSDRTASHLGRRMPYILAGTLTAVLLMQGIPLSAGSGSLLGFMLILGLLLLAMASYRSPAVALMPDVTPKPLRSKANAVINLMGAAGSILSLGMIALLSPKGESYNYTLLFRCLAAVMLLSLLLLLSKVREPAMALPPDEEAAGQGSPMANPAIRRSFLLILCSIFLWFFGYNAVITFFSNYAKNYWGLEKGMFSYALIVAQAAAIVAFLPMGILAERFGRRKMILGGIVLLSLSFLAGGSFPSFSPVILGLFALAGIAWAAINVNSLPMVVELCRGGDVGRYTGYYYTASMSAQILTPILVGALIEVFGYGILFRYGALFAALSFITMFFVRHGDARPAKEEL